MTRRSSSDMPAPRGREVPDDLAEPDIEPIPFFNAKLAPVEKVMKNRLSGKPLFPYPPELNEKHKPYWMELVSSFKEGFFHPADVPLLKLYCRCAHDIERCNLMIEEEGDVVMGPRGPMVNPRVKVRAQSEAVLLNLTTKLRAQPASRGNSTEFQRNNGKAAVGREADETVNSDEDDLLGIAESRGSSHARHLN